MGHNSFGTLFSITTWGESHGKGVGVVIDGCPALIEISEEEVDAALLKRAPGKSRWTSPRKEPDRVEILSGVFRGKTTGAPLCMLIRNRDQDSSKYKELEQLLRPGHANGTYLKKYGIFDHRGGGRASARETACRVAAGVVAQKVVEKWGVEIFAGLRSLGGIRAKGELGGARLSELHCPHPETEHLWQAELTQVMERGDSLGGVVEVVAKGVPPGWGEPLYQKLEAQLAAAMLSIPASKGFEIGEGFAAADSTGLQHNDSWERRDEGCIPSSNSAGGSLGGISTGADLVVRVPFKPTSSIGLPQQTVNLEGERKVLSLPPGSRHDPCVAIRAVPVCQAMMALVLADFALLHRSRFSF